ncbi:hypothetical protein T12_11029 [Trichinella patagoniensis]|uniref:Uncharacterized protein n=1 Tax=Trichinella patagoniensis TaxID=990121 RepID=A0A0V0ZMN9_9BILA|nr:hypothetical protein T12_11029 [Trichinella patagoniensis]
MLYDLQIRNHGITKHYYQLMPLSLATYSKKTRKLWGEALGVASGYAPGQIKICIFPQATPKAFYCTIFDLRGPRRRLRLCPRENRNLHIPAGYAQIILLHNICLQGDMQIFPLRLPPGFCHRFSSLLLQYSIWITQ